MVTLQLEIFLLMAVGYFLAYRNILSAAARKQITSLILNLVLPAAVVKSFEIDLGSNEVRTIFVVLLCSIGIQLLYSLFARIFWKNTSAEHRINLRYGTLVSNAGFMGMPIAQQVYGSLGLLYASIFLIPQRVVMWSAGLSLYTHGERNSVIKQVLTHPCIIALEIGIVMLVLRMNGIYLPAALDSTIGAIAGCNTALSMMMIGGMMADAGKADVFTKETLEYSLIRLIVLPAIIWGVLTLIHVDALAKAVCVVLSGMPAASTTAMLAQKYDRDPAFASKMIFVSTLLSLFTLPLLTGLAAL